jgi:hypothetical protein
MKRSILYGLVALIPLVIFWAIIPTFDPNRIVREIPASAPQWIEQSAYTTCDAAITGTPVTNQTPAIDQSRAARIGAGVVESQTDLLTLSGRNSVAFTPVLLQRQFPDNQSHLVWAYGEGRITDKIGMEAAAIGMEAMADVVYIDASTGDPLLLIKNIFTEDPGFTCFQIYKFDTAHIQKQSVQAVLYLAGLLISAVYVVVSIIIGRRSYRRQPAALTTHVS